MGAILHQLHHASREALVYFNDSRLSIWNQMNFELLQAVSVLERTPNALHAMLDRLSPDWTIPNEGPDTWAPYDVVGHLIHGERTDWIPRARIILAQGPT